MPAEEEKEVRRPGNDSTALYGDVNTSFANIPVNGSASMDGIDGGSKVDKK